MDWGLKQMKATGCEKVSLVRWARNIGMGALKDLQAGRSACILHLFIFNFYIFRSWQLQHLPQIPKHSA